MSVISTVALITAKPGHAAEVGAALRTLAEATHAEDGCLLYSLQQGLEDENVFVTVEKWDSTASLQAHLSSEHIAAALANTESVLAAPPQIIPTQFLDAGDPAKSTY